MSKTVGVVFGYLFKHFVTNIVPEECQRETQRMPKGWGQTGDRGSMKEHERA